MPDARSEECIHLRLHALARIRTETPYGTTPSRWRVYQFHHQGVTADFKLQTSDFRPAHLTSDVLRLISAVPTGATGLEPATSRVTVECSNQTELRPHSPNGNRTRLCTLKGCRPGP